MSIKFTNRSADNLKIAYIGGGSRGWAWNFMSDLAMSRELGGQVCLYDIDYEAAKANEIIGNSIKSKHPDTADFEYKATETLEQALTGADFVIISILPGTFDEMESDVHSPEKYGIYQSVGDTVGPGGIIRALRTIPMFEEIARAIRNCCPDAWVINYTNPMTVCVRTLYRIFPEIKAFGCCHEVFGTQNFLAKILKEYGIGEVSRTDIKVNVVGVNHFTWLTSARYRDLDIFPIYREYCLNHNGRFQADDNWMNKYFVTHEMVKMDLFMRYGYIAAAGDRHLAEFCPGGWFLKDPETVKEWGFALTPVSWRKENLKDRLEMSKKLLNGEMEFELKKSGEEGVRQIKAILGFGDLVTNVNLPNRGQIPNLPCDAVVETNACFTAGSVTPLFAGNVPDNVMTLMAQTVYIQECTVEAGLKKDLDLAFTAFIKDPLMTASLKDARTLYNTMISNTSHYLKDYS